MDTLFLTQTLLFQGITEEEIRSMLDCLGAEARKFYRGQVIFHAGVPVRSIGLVISGSVSIEQDDPWGNKSVMDKVGPGQVFAETYACVPGEPLMVSVVAAESTEALFLNAERLLTVCSSSCDFHGKLIRNMLAISARKNLTLSRRIQHTSAKSIRGRLLSYLSFQSLVRGSQEFDIPFDRQQLADYLGVDRSAMSNELSKMRREGLLETERSHFVLLQPNQ